MYQLRTKPTDNSVVEFIENLTSPKKRVEAYQLLDIFAEVTQMDAKLWGSDLIGYGAYHYKYASGHEGDAAPVGFSPRKAKNSLYCWLNEPRRTELLSMLGKHTSGVACIYVNKLEDIDLDVLKVIIKEALDTVRGLYPDGFGRRVGE